MQEFLAGEQIFSFFSNDLHTESLHSGWMLYVNVTPVLASGYLCVCMCVCAQAVGV